MEEEKPTLYLDCSVFDEQRETLSFFGGRNLRFRDPRLSSLLVEPIRSGRESSSERGLACTRN